MSDQLSGKKGSSYPVVNSAFGPEDRARFLETTLVHAVGKIVGSETYTDGNLTLEDLKSDQIQADWEEVDDTKPSYIQNKPTIPSLDGYSTEEELASVSGQIVSQIPSTEGLATEAELSSVSGQIISQIPSLDGYATEQYVEATVSGKADKTEIPDVSDFVNHSELEDAVDMKMDKSQSADFYPASNPEGYISSIPDEYVTDTEMSSYVSEQTSAYITSEDLPDVSDMATKTWVNEQGYLTSIPSEYVTDSELESAVSGKADKTEIPDVSDMATKTWISEQGYLTVIPDEYVTSAELSSTSAAIVEEIPEVPTAAELAGNGLSAVEDKLVVDKPIPSTSAANNGDVLTYSSDSIVWAPVQGGGGSSGGYTVYNLQPTNADLIVNPYKTNEKIYVINAVNKGLYFLDLSNVTDENFEYIRVVAPDIGASEYWDIVVQVTHEPSSDYTWQPVNSSIQLMDGNWTTSSEWLTWTTECHIFGKHFVVSDMSHSGGGE